MRLIHVVIGLIVFTCIQGCVVVMLAFHTSGDEGVSEHIGHVKGGSKDADPTSKLEELQRRVDRVFDPSPLTSPPSVFSAQLETLKKMTKRSPVAGKPQVHKSTGAAATPSTDAPTTSQPPTTTEAPFELPEEHIDANTPTPPSPGTSAYLVPSGDVNVLDGMPGQLTRLQQSDPTNRELLMNNGPPSSLVHLQQAAVVVLCHNRPNYLAKALLSVLDARLSGGIKKYVSQDGDDAATSTQAKSYTDFEYLHHPQSSNGIFQQESPRVRHIPGTAYLASHYKWVLDTLFIKRHHSHVIIIEDDMVISSDFFEMFESLAPLLELDPTLWCISSWNDNGFREFNLPKDKFFRTSYFPGLGWMLKRSLWVGELTTTFPLDNWDHWMRGTSVSQRRECICPWQSRNRNIGAVGTTIDGEFFQQYIARVQSSDGAPITKGYGDLTYLLNRNYFDSMRVRVSPPKGMASERERETYHEAKMTEMSPLSGTSYQRGHRYVFSYDGGSFNVGSMQLGIRTSPRAHYRHILWIQFNGADIFLVHKRLSPFVNERALMHSKLAAVPATGTGRSCEVTCSEHRADVGLGSNGAWECAEDQFDFINDCQVLTHHLKCPQGCTQGWGDEIPCIESNAILGHPPMCLTTEMRPTCAASHPKTRRLCPCVPQSDSGVPYGALGVNSRLPFGHKNRYIGGGQSKVVVVAASTAGVSCSEVCSNHQDGEAVGGYRCDTSSFDRVNTCTALQQAFDCELCTVSRGGDLPNFVSNPADGQYRRCLTSFDPSTCDGSHPNTRRLCPCVAR